MGAGRRTGLWFLRVAGLFGAALSLSAARAEAPSGEPPIGDVGPPVPPMPQPPGMKEEEVFPERDDFSSRFPSREADVRERERAAARRAPPPPPLPLEGEALCRTVGAEARTTCPYQLGQVAALEEIPRGVRVRYRKGSVDAETLRAAFDCQEGLARVSPSSPPLCPPLLEGGAVRTIGEGRGGTTFVDVTVSGRGDVATLREQVRTAFPDAPRRPARRERR
jgi:hypothetical protein